MPVLRDVTLVPKVFVKQSVREGSKFASGKKGGKPSTSGKQKTGGKKVSKPEYQAKYKMCHLFNEGACNYGDKCKFRHLCSGCGSKSHNEQTCTNTSN